MTMDWLKKQRPGESGMAFAARLHDEAHGQVCNCLWARANGRGSRLLPESVSLDTVAEGKRVERWKAAQ